MSVFFSVCVCFDKQEAKKQKVKIVLRKLQIMVMQSLHHHHVIM